MSDLKLTQVPKDITLLNDRIGPFPICCVGEYLCKHPGYQWQIFNDSCDHCLKLCHEDCGQLLDVPHKFTEPNTGFYCNNCISFLPKFLYPKIPKNGIPRNVPKNEHDGKSFEIFMNKRKVMLEQKTATVSKKKVTCKVKENVSINTRSHTSRPHRSSVANKNRSSPYGRL